MGKILKISGPLIIAEDMLDSNMYDIVRVGNESLMGEIIEMHQDKAYIQVYEDTTGLKKGETVTTDKMPLCATLGPGLLTGIFDGIQRPLHKIMEITGDNLKRGIRVSSLDENKLWNFIPSANKGDKIISGDVIGTVQETPSVIHKICVPHNISGEVTDIKTGEFHIFDCICKIKTSSGEENITMVQKWPVRTRRPYLKKIPLDIPLVTGQRVIDTLFPVAKGGVAAVPGPFGSGKTVVQHQLAKWADADIIVYIGCGERGNEMTDVLNEFPEIKDPKTGRSLMERCVLIANTSDMPVAAREASIYTGITIAEYYRDMGYSVALMADSTSRWAEALREMSARLEEMPGEEGYPAYLSSRLAQFYERAGRVLTNGTTPSEGAVTVIGAVSPPGGDISEPVSQATLRIVKTFWGLDSTLAYRRHFPAINWLKSYSLYLDSLSKWYSENVSDEWNESRLEIMNILGQEEKLQEVVQLMGFDALSKEDKVKLETARIIREDFLHQNAFHKIDTYSSLKKQFFLVKLILTAYNSALSGIKTDSTIKDELGRFKYVPEENIEEEYSKIMNLSTRESNSIWF